MQTVPPPEIGDPQCEANLLVRPEPVGVFVNGKMHLVPPDKVDAFLAGEYQAPELA